MYELTQTNPYVASVAAAYDSWARSYEEDTRNWSYIAAQKVALAIVEKAQGLLRHIVDAGIGTGQVIDRLKQDFPQASYSGLEISPNMIDECRKKHSGIRLHHCNINDDLWPIESGNADAVTCAGVLSMIGNLDHVFSQAAQTLKSGGLFSTSFLIRQETEVDMLHEAEPYKLFPRSYEDMHEKAEKAGLKLVDENDGKEFVGFKVAGYAEIYGFCVYQKPKIG